MHKVFEQEVATRYHLYNSLFLNLPFDNIYQTGTLLPLLQQHAAKCFDEGKDPVFIIHEFFNNYTRGLSFTQRIDLLFRFVQYVEREIVLFDSIEDASFEKINDLNGHGTLTSLLVRCRAENKMSKLVDKLHQFSVRVVLTAHPTQFYPGTVLGIINDLEQAIRGDNLAEINGLLLQLGKTPIFNRQKPSPYDEAVSLCWYLENIFYHVVPDIVMRLIEACNHDVQSWPNFNLLRIGFWPGGDRDGNPYVTHDVTLKVAARLKETILKCYHRDLRTLRRRLTFRKVYELVVKAEQNVYQAIYYPEKGYQHADELLQILNDIRQLLIEEHQGLFVDLIDRLIAKLKIFGFFMASLDIRQNNKEIASAWKEIFRLQGRKDFEKLDEEEKIAEMLRTEPGGGELTNADAVLDELLATMKAIFRIQQANGEAACHRFIISNCHAVSDIITVFQLGRMIYGTRHKLPLDIVPLFESIDDLARAGIIIERLYRIPEYRKHLESRGNTQTIMLGFSDGTKDGGYLRANWSIFRAKEELTRLSRNQGIKVIFFDGRGGPPARGGGNTHDFYASLGKTVENHEVQITIQGQTISSNFGRPANCRYNLEQLLSAGLESEIFREQQYQLTDQDRKIMDDLAEAAYQAYRRLKQHKKFTAYLEKATPLKYFSETNIASRPVKRTNSAALKLEDLRAIPFVGSWALKKQNVPGFYGVGSALLALKRKGQEAGIKNLYRNSLFFRTLLSNSMMSLAKTFYPATSYLAKDKEFGPLWNILHREYRMACKALLQVTQLKELMEDKPLNRASVQLREQIMLPLIVIQQYALQLLRSGRQRRHEEKLHRLVLRSMFGIINGSRNSA
jgi:phosphoenolpyruvate carboxylase